MFRYQSEKLQFKKLPTLSMHRSNYNGVNLNEIRIDMDDELNSIQTSED